MKTVTVVRTLKSSIEQVFELIADHEGYTRLPGVKMAKVTQKGKTEPNGLGAMREIKFGPAWFREEITAFERPTRMDYKIVKSRPPIDHEGGSVKLRSVAGGTEVIWTSTFRIAIPLIGGLLTRLAARTMAKRFSDGLAAVDELARAKASA